MGDQKGWASVRQVSRDQKELGHTEWDMVRSCYLPLRGKVGQGEVWNGKFRHNRSVPNYATGGGGGGWLCNDLVNVECSGVFLKNVH